MLALVLLVLLWKRLRAEVRAYAVSSLLLLAGYISFYARYTYWAGDFAWGDRYVSTAVRNGGAACGAAAAALSRKSAAVGFGAVASRSSRSAS